MCCNTLCMLPCCGFEPLRSDICGSAVECLIVCALYVCLLSFGFVAISGSRSSAKGSRLVVPCLGRHGPARPRRACRRMAGGWPSYTIKMKVFVADGALVSTIRTRCPLCTIKRICFEQHFVSEICEWASRSHSEHPMSTSDSKHRMF